MYLKLDLPKIIYEGKVNTLKKSYGPPKKKGTLAQRMKSDADAKAAMQKILDDEMKARLRMGWAYVIAMAETEGVELSKEQIQDVVTNMDANLEEYEQLRKKNGEEYADSKMYERCCQVLGEDTSNCDYQYEKLFDPKLVKEIKDEKESDQNG